MFISIFIMFISIWVYSQTFIFCLCIDDMSNSQDQSEMQLFFHSFSSISSLLHGAHASLVLLVCLELSGLCLSDIQLFSLSIHYEMI